MSSNLSVVESPEGILDVLRNMNRGNTLFDLEDALRTVVEKAIEHGASGKIELHLEVKQDPQSDAIRITPDIKVKVPKAPKKATLFFAGLDGSLTRANPNQHEMNLD